MTTEEMLKVSRSTKNDAFKCDVCMAVFASRRTLNYHKGKKHSNVNPSCDICGLSLNSNAALIVHKRIHLWEKQIAEKEYRSPVYECSVCDFQTRSPRNLVLHSQEETHHRLANRKSSKKRPIPRFLYDGNLNKLPTKCAEFSNDMLLNTVKCPLCSVFICENRIKGHFMTAHPFEKSIFCTYCAAIIVKREEMILHLLEHSQGKLYMCDFCECLFISAQALATHSRLHTSQRPFSCSVCQKEFQSKTAAVAHFHSHLKIEMLRDTKEEAPPQTEVENDEYCRLLVEELHEFVNGWD